MCVIKAVFMQNTFIRYQFDKFDGKRMTASSAEIRERHPISATDADVNFVDHTGKPVGRDPALKSTLVGKRLIDSLGRRSQYSV